MTYIRHLICIRHNKIVNRNSAPIRSFIPTGQSIVNLLLAAFFMFIMFLPAFSLAGTVSLPQTGQTTCSAESGRVISCTGTGQDGDTLAGVAWPSPRFTNNGDGTMTDNLTGLVWTQDANLPAASKTWQQALDYVAGMNAGTYPNLGHTDWRLPNVNELESLVNSQQSNLAT